jgi:tetratricopeptide (TPR) repeat protein
MADSFYDNEEDGNLNDWEQAEKKAIEAQELYENGEMLDALDKLDEAVAMNPNCSSWHFNRGLTLDALGKYEEAIACYQSAMELSPDDVEAMNCLAVDYTRTVQYDQAIELFEKITTIDPAFEPAYCNRIITYTEMEQHDLAEQMFYLAQQINPECPICFYNIGNSLFTQGKYGRAIWCWEKTATLESTHPQINYRIAQACWADKQYDKAKEYFLKELREQPGNIETLLDYGIFLLEINQVKRAEEKFQWVLELRPDFAPATFYLGEIRRTEGQTEEAIRYYRKAIQLDDTCPGAHYRLAQLLMYLGKTEEIYDLLEAELKLDCEDNQVLLSIGRMLLQIEKFETATHCFLRILDSNPNEGRAYFGMSAVLMHKKDIAGCLQFLEHSISLDIPELTAYICAALILCRQGNYRRANCTLNKAGAILGNSLRLMRWKMKVRYFEIKQNCTDWFRSHFTRSS